MNERGGTVEQTICATVNLCVTSGALHLYTTAITTSSSTTITYMLFVVYTLGRISERTSKEVCCLSEMMETRDRA